jgi:hypothetical protein
LWHVADPWTRDSAFRKSRLMSQDENVSAIQSATSDEATQQGRLTATASSEQTVSVINEIANKLKELESNISIQ